MAKITKDMVIKDILAVDNGLITILRQAGMNCLGCPSSQWETLAQAALGHGMLGDDINRLVDLLNEYLEKE